MTEWTLAVIKPDAYPKSKEIIVDIKQSGLKVKSKKTVALRSSRCRDFYKEHSGKAFFDDLVEYMTSGPCKVLLLEGKNAISKYRQLIGPTDALKAKETHPDCLRAKYGTSSHQNGLHGSDSIVSASREINFFFPKSVCMSSDKRQLWVGEYLADSVTPILTAGLAQLCQVQPKDPVMWLAQWLDDNRKT